MVLAKADADIARLYDERLVPLELRPLGRRLRDLLSQAVRVVLGLTGQSLLLAHASETRESISVRNSYQTRCTCSRLSFWPVRGAARATPAAAWSRRCW